MSFWKLLFHGDEYLKQEIRKQVGKKIAKLTERIGLLEQELEQTKREQMQLKQRVQAQAQQIRDLEQWRTAAKVAAPVVKDAEPRKPAPVMPMPEKKPFDIKRFSIPKPDKVLIRTASDVVRAMENIKNIDSLCAFLKNYGDKDAMMIAKLVAQYQERVERFESALPQKRKKWDDEMVSEEATGAVFDIMKKSLLTQLPVAILRGSAKNPLFYGGLLEELNKYLARCGVYTLMPSSKAYFNDDDCHFMEIQPLPTKNRGDDKRVEAIERLPYCLDYIDEDEDRQVCQLDGQMTVYRFEA